MIAQKETMTALWHTACERLLYSRRDQLDRWTGLTTVLYDNLLAAKSMEFTLDVGKDLWLTEKRFPKLQRDYLDPTEIEPFLMRCEKIANSAARRGVITQMSCRKATQLGGFRDTHAWGNCMLGFTYHGGKKWSKPTLGLHSRVSYIAYIGAMDMALAWVMAREIATRTGIAVEEMAFRWYIDSLQWHGVKSIPYVLANGHEDAVMDDKLYDKKQYPTVGCTRRSILSLDKHYQAGTGTEKLDNPYGPMRRMRIRYGRYRDEDFLPSVPIESLKLLPYPTGETTS